MAGYNCRIEYIQGTTNTCADLLSRHPDNVGLEKERDEQDVSLDVNDNSYQVNVLDSTNFDPNSYASCELPHEDSLQKPETLDLKDFDMYNEQSKDDDLMTLKSQVENGGDPGKNNQRHYLIVDKLLYYISNTDYDPCLRLYVPKHLKRLVIGQYHDRNGHMGVQKTFDSIRRKCFWPNLFKDLNEYVRSCVICQTRSLQKVRQPLQETDIPPYPMAKVSLDLSGPYPTSLSGNKYMIAFVDWFSGWPEAYAVPDKTAETVAHLLLEEIFPRHGSCLQIVTDNGTENVNNVVKETLESLNIDHVLSSVYHPQSNAKVERFHRTLHDVLAKRLADDQQTWDLHLNQALAAIRFNVSESSKYSPFYLLYNRDVVLPVDNLLKPRRKYHGEEEHKITLQEQHKAFLTVRNNLRKAKRRQARYADRNTKSVDLKVGDPVYYKNNRRKGKLDLKWKPFYRILEKRGPVTYIIKNQLDGSTSKVHAEMLRLANIEDWELKETKDNRRLCNAAYVIPPQASESSSDSESDPDMNVPLNKLLKRYRHEREDSESEDNIPLMELAKRLKARDEVSSPVVDSRSEDIEMDSELSSDNLRVDEVQMTRKRSSPRKHKKHDYQADKMQIMKMIIERL